MVNYKEDKDLFDALVPNASAPIKIDIFDFDGTIFNSPVPNRKLWDSKTYGRLMEDSSRGGLGWFQHNVTLSNKYIQGSDFNYDVVNEVRKSMADPSAVTVMLTGRDTTFTSHVLEILARESLVFDEYGFKPAPKAGEIRTTTMNFKQDFINGLISKYGVRKVSMWEDRPKHVTKFNEFLTAIGVNNGVHYIEKPEVHMEPALEQELVRHLIASAPSYAPHPRTESVERKRKPLFCGVFLYNDSHDLLVDELGTYIPHDWKIFAHHMTICLGMSKNPTTEQYINDHIGMESNMTAVAIGISSDAIAVKVESDVPTDNKVAHVTIATPPNGKPYNSNKITEWKPLDTPIKLSGLIDAFYP